jgi:uncharacterized DUF497 family protein
MLIIWDEPKRQSNIVKHSLDFADLSEAFFLSSYTEPAQHGRILAIGELDGTMIVAVVYRPLGIEAVSVISMRPANRAERSRANG